jgi:hypothetical protein
MSYSLATLWHERNRHPLSVDRGLPIPDGAIHSLAIKEMRA